MKRKREYKNKGKNNKQKNKTKNKARKKKNRKRKFQESNIETEENITEIDNGDTSTYEINYNHNNQQPIRRSKRMRHQTVLPYQEYC